MAATEEIEINFRLDADGRTADPKATEAATTALNYEPRTQQCQFVSAAKDDASTTKAVNKEALMDDLLYDCEIADNGLMPRTFWMPCQGQAPRCSLEQLALDVFAHHTRGTTFDPETSGAEWWVQIRPSPPAGRYTMHDPPSTGPDDKKNDSQADLSQAGISFHWDKDEDLRILCGGSTYIHPHLSTVTYLTALGAPTLVANCRVNNMTGDWMVPKPTVEGLLSWPASGKHLSFDGRYLHAAPSDLLPPGVWEQQTALPSDALDMTTQQRTKLARRHRRVTFLVNVWLNYKPFGVQLFPESMVDKLSGHIGSKAFLRFADSSGSDQEETKGSARTTTTIQNGADAKGMTSFRWPMGDCGSNEYIRLDLPLDQVQEAADMGDSIRLQWTSTGYKPTLQLLRGNEVTLEDETNGEPAPKRARVEDA